MRPTACACGPWWRRRAPCSVSASIAELGRDPASRLDCLVAGTNDLVKETGIRPGADRRNLVPLLMQMVVAARAGGLDVIDGVSNDFRDLDAFAARMRRGARPRL